MKVAYICSDVDVPVFGPEGCSIHVREVVNALQRLGHEVRLFCASLGRPDGSMTGIPTYSFDADGDFGGTLSLLRDEPLIQEQSLYRDLYSVLFNVWLQQAVLPVFCDDPPDVIYERYSMFSNAGLHISRARGIPFILEVNSPLRKEQQGYHAFTLTQTAASIQRELLHNADQVISVSKWLRDWMVSEGASSERIEVVPNGISAQVFGIHRTGDVIRARHQLVGKKVIGYVGSFQTWHDLQGLTDAFKTLLNSDDTVRLLLVGGGEDRGRIESRLKAGGLLDKTVFAGHVPYDEVPEYLAAMDVPVVPYTKISDFYFSPIKLFECMASGRPTVAASIGQIEEVIVHRKTGWLYRPGDTSDLVDAIRTLLYNEQLSSAIGAAGRTQIMNAHTWKAVAQRIVSLAGTLSDRNTGLAEAARSKVPSKAEVCK